MPILNIFVPSTNYHEKLRDMRPSFSIQQEVYSGSSNIVFGSQVEPGYVAVMVPLTNFCYLSFRKFRSVIFYALSVFSFLCKHISHIVGMCARKQVIRVTASWIIALMQNAKTFGDWSIGKFPRKTMGKHILVLVSSLAVSVFGFATLPFPAIVWITLGDSVPKTLFYFIDVASRGMICHSKFSFQNLLTPSSDSSRCGGIFAWLISPNFSTKTLILQSRMAK